MSGSALDRDACALIEFVQEMRSDRMHDVDLQRLRRLVEALALHIGHQDVGSAVVRQLDSREPSAMLAKVASALTRVASNQSSTAALSLLGLLSVKAGPEGRMYSLDMLFVRASQGNGVWRHARRDTIRALKDAVDTRAVAALWNRCASSDVNLKQRGWLQHEGLRGPWYTYDPVAAMPEEMTFPLPSDIECAGVLDVDGKATELLPIPSGRDLRIHRWLSTIRNRSAYEDAASLVANMDRRRALESFAIRAATLAVRRDEPAFVESAFLAATLAEEGRMQWYDSRRILAIVVRAAQLLDACGRARMMSEAVLGPDRAHLLAPLFVEGADLLGIAGAEETQSAEGFVFRFT